MLERTYRDTLGIQPAAIWATFLLAVLVPVLLWTLYEVHPLLPSVCAVSLTLLLFFNLFPTATIFAWVLLFPIQSVVIELSFTWRIHRLYPPELFALLMSPVLLIKVLADSGNPGKTQRPVWNELAWMSWLLAAFIPWSIICLLLMSTTNEAFISWWKLVSNFVMAFFVLICMDSYEKFIKLFIFFSLLAVIHSVLATLSNFYAMERIYYVVDSSPVPMRFMAYFINDNAGFNWRAVGLTLSSGFSARHELGIFLTSATFFSLFIIHWSRSLATKAFFCVLIVLYTTAQMMAFPKGSLLGILTTLIILVMLVPDWRKRCILIISGLFSLWYVANALSKTLQPGWQRMFSAASAAENLANKSAVKGGTIANRLKLMGEAIDLFWSSHGVGYGPDSVWFRLFQGVHGHNIVLTYAADYGMLGIVFVLGMYILLARLAWRKVLVRPETGNPIWVLRVTVLACLMLAVFEYSLDLHIWYAQLYFMAALFLAALRLDDKMRQSLQG